MDGITYDTGALVGAEKGDRLVWAIHAELLEDEIVPTIPSPVLAEAWRGGARQARLSRLLASCVVEPLTEEQARAVGVLCGQVDHSDVVDGSVAEGALRRGDAVVTADADEMRKLGRGRLRIIAI
ncbi:MAG TPA: PIN domain-containing protein [Gemmatimonadaceae bacterium]